MTGPCGIAQVEKMDSYFSVYLRSSLSIGFSVVSLTLPSLKFALVLLSLQVH